LLSVARLRGARLRIPSQKSTSPSCTVGEYMRRTVESHKPSDTVGEPISPPTKPRVPQGLLQASGPATGAWVRRRSALRSSPTVIHELASPPRMKIGLFSAEYLVVF
jgi:hypothetical protein